MELLEQFEAVKKETREYLKAKLFEYLYAVDDGEFDKANEIRHLIRPHSHMFYVIGINHLENIIRMYPDQDYYQIIRMQEEITRLDLYMENHWKFSLLRFTQYPGDYEKEYTLI